jgi:transcriptional regulator with XRE-family HTH domain
MTVRQLADAIGVDDTVLTAVENGTERSTNGLLNKLSDRLRVPLDELQSPKS